MRRLAGLFGGAAAVLCASSALADGITVQTANGQKTIATHTGANGQDNYIDLLSGYLSGTTTVSVVTLDPNDSGLWEHTTNGATGAVQAQQLIAEQNSAAALGAKGDAPCSADSGTCSVIALLERENARLTALIQAIGSPAQVSNLPSTQPVSATSLPLPAGAATSANQPALNSDGGALTHITNLPATQTVSGSVSVSNLPSTQAVSGTVGLAPGSSVSVSNLPSTQPVSGTVGLAAGSTVSVSNLPATQPISASSLPLPTGAATAQGQTNIVNALTPTGGLPVTIVGGSAAGGGGGGAVTAALGSYAAGSIVDIGTGATPAPYTINANLGTLHNDLTSQASVPIYCAVPGSSSGAVAPCNTATVNTNLTGTLAGGTANSSLIFNLPKMGEGSFAFSVASMGSGEVISVLESRDNGATYQPAMYSTVSATGQSTITSAGNYTLSARATNLQFVVSTPAAAAVTTTINGQTTTSNKYVAISDPLPTGSNTIGGVTLAAGPNSGANVVGTVNITTGQTVGLAAGTQAVGTVGLNNTGLGGSAATPLYTAGAAAVNLGAVINVPTSASTATFAQLVAAFGSTSIYVTAYDLSVLTQATEQFVYGTGTACGTGTTPISGQMFLGSPTTPGGIVQGDGGSNILGAVPPGQNLCLETTSLAATANTTGGTLGYKQY